MPQPCAGLAFSHVMLTRTVWIVSHVYNKPWCAGRSPLHRARALPCSPGPCMIAPVLDPEFRNAASQHLRTPQLLWRRIRGRTQQRTVQSVPRCQQAAAAVGARPHTAALGDASAGALGAAWGQCDRPLPEGEYLPPPTVLAPQPQALEAMIDFHVGRVLCLAAIQCRCIQSAYCAVQQPVCAAAGLRCSVISGRGANVGLLRSAPWQCANC